MEVYVTGNMLGRVEEEFDETFVHFLHIGDRGLLCGSWLCLLLCRWLGVLLPLCGRLRVVALRFVQVFLVGHVLVGLAVGVGLQLHGFLLLEL